MNVTQIERFSGLFLISLIVKQADFLSFSAIHRFVFEIKGTICDLSVNKRPIAYWHIDWKQLQIDSLINISDVVKSKLSQIIISVN